MNTPPDILPLIARSGLAEDELLGFVEGELPAERAAAIVRTLAEHPELSHIVMAMRGDRNDLASEHELTAAEPDRSFVESVVHQGVTGEIDPEFAARFEAMGGGDIQRMHRPRVVRSRGLRFPTRAVGTLLAACVAVVFFGAIWAAWPSPPARPGPSNIAQAPAAASPELDGARNAGPIAAAGPIAIADASPVAPASADWGPTTVIATPAEALAAAEEGRLVIRVYSPSASRGRWLVESITMAPSVSRVAVLEGQLADHEADRIAGAIPVPTGPVYAGDPSGLEPVVGEQAGRASWVYMVEVEPTERGMSLLVAGLSREPGMLVELLRSGEPVTTPGSAGDISWFRKPSRDWTRRIAAPVVVQSGER